MRWMLPAALLWLVAGAAPAQVCDLSCQRDQRRASLEALDLAPLAADVQLASFRFAATRFVATEYVEPLNPRLIDYPAYVGLAWLVDLGTAPAGRVIDLRRAVRNLAAENPKAFYFESGILYDFNQGREILVRPSIDFFLAYADILAPDLRPKVVLSGPFWRIENSGEQPIGLVQLPGAGLVQEYLSNFSARHVLCLRPGAAPAERIRLMDRARMAEDNRSELLVDAFNKSVVESCDSAVQVGPNYFEVRGPQDSPANKVGISGSSVREGKRSAVIQIERDTGPHTFLLTTVSEIGSFDMMVAIEAVADRLAGPDSIAWAVGVQDDSLLSGPIVIDGAHAMRLTPTNVPAAALIVFE